ncbi:universal stress protein [Paraflavisolibacter sp. H34]|uniref:universal stress protein n=1 Tax=Huijunlia imazamoxiresistens TaxID=3127457 RepID=UPI0030197622
MEKIIWVISSQGVRKEVLDFTCYLARLTRSRLTGLVLDNSAKETPAPQMERRDYFAATAEPGTDQQILKMDAGQCIRWFEEGCEQRGVRSETLCLKGEPAEVVLAESRYADLVLVDPGCSFKDTDEPLPSSFSRELFARAECPVIVLPCRFKGIDEVVFCYDGSRSSVFAMKLFTYLLPQLSDRKAVVLEVAEAPCPASLDKEKILDWLKGHYSVVSFEVETGNAGDELFTYFLRKQNLFIVMGAYGRGRLSQLFHESSADRVLRVVNLPLFIAHC